MKKGHSSAGPEWPEVREERTRWCGAGAAAKGTIASNRPA